MSNEQLQNIVNQFLALVQKGQFAQAKAYADMPTICQLNNPQVIQARAMTMLNVGEELAAKKAFLALLPYAQVKHVIHNVVADLSAKLGEFEDAKKHFTYATNQDSKIKQYWLNWGLCENRQLNTQQANTYFQNALKLDPQYHKARFEYAKGLNKLGKFAKAKLEFEKLIATNTTQNNWKWHICFAESLEGIGDLQAAQKQYIAALTLNDQEYRLYESLAINYLTLNHNNEAIKYLEQGITALPSNAILHDLLASLRFEMGHPEPLMSYRLTKKEHMSAEMKRDQITSLITQNELDTAKQLLDEIPQQSNHFDVFTNLRCDIAIKEQKFEKVMSYLPSKVEPFENGFTQIKELTILSQFGLGDYKNAGSNIDTLLNIEPNNQYYWALKSTELKLLDPHAYAQLMRFQQLLCYSEIELGNDYTSLADFNEQLLVAIATLHNTVVHPLQQSGVGGTQTPGYLFDQKQKVIQDLKLALINTAQTQLAALALLSPCEHPVLTRYTNTLNIVTAWSMWLQDGGFHRPHCHPKGWYSSAYYVQTPRSISGQSTAGNIVFGEPGIFTYDTVKPDCAFVPQMGHLALFPSFYWHKTEPFSDSKPRVCVAFDILPAGN